MGNIGAVQILPENGFSGKKGDPRVEPRGSQKVKILFTVTSASFAPA
jgi:hypothetical protein